MIKVHEGLYVNEDIIAIAAMNEETGGVKVLFKQPIEFPKTDEDGEETIGLMLSINIEEEFANGFLNALDLISYDGYDEMQELMLHRLPKLEDDEH